MSTAYFSTCKKYRYWLTRGDMRKPLVFCLLNPSYADDNINDPTARRCMGFAEGFGYSGIVIVNAYAYIETESKKLKHYDEPVGPVNDIWLETASMYNTIVCGWGNHVVPDTTLPTLSKFGARLYCLVKNKNGSPRHPLYAASATQLENYP